MRPQDASSSCDFCASQGRSPVDRTCCRTPDSVVLLQVRDEEHRHHRAREQAAGVAGVADILALHGHALLEPLGMRLGCRPHGARLLGVDSRLGTERYLVSSKSLGFHEPSKEPSVGL